MGAIVIPVIAITAAAAAATATAIAIFNTAERFDSRILCTALVDNLPPPLDHAPPPLHGEQRLIGRYTRYVHSVPGLLE